MDKQGFTLLETVAITMLSGLMLCSISLGTQYTEQIAFTTFVRQVENGIKSAQYMANLTGKGYNVYCASRAIYIRQGINKAIYKFALSKHVSLSYDTTFKQMNFLGKLGPTQGGSIVLVDTRLAKKARITIRVATGKTTVYYEKL